MNTPTKGHEMTPGMLSRFFQRLFGMLPDAPPAPKRQEYLKRGPTQRSRRGRKGSGGAAKAKRLAKRRRLNVIAKESRRRNRR